MRKLRVMGVDPGMSGAIATYNGKVLRVRDIPSMKAETRGNEINVPGLINIVESLILGCNVVYFERGRPYPHDGKGTAWKSGESYGLIRGVIAVYCMTIIRVTPNTWKKEMRLTTNKELSRARAIERFPKYERYFRRKKDHNRAEAALLAYYGYQEERKKHGG